MKTTFSTFVRKSKVVQYFFALMVTFFILLLIVAFGKMKGETIASEGLTDHEKIEQLNAEITEMQKQLLDEGKEYDKHNEIMTTAQAAMAYHAGMAQGIRDAIENNQREINTITSRGKSATVSVKN